MGKKWPPLKDRFFSRVHKTDGCWIFTGSKDSCGYGLLRNGNCSRAHRVSWEIHFGEIPKHLSVLHVCDNPPCVRPDHLFLGTAKENSDDKIKKGRGIAGKNKAVIPASKKHEIKTLNRKGISYAGLAEVYGYSVRTIGRICTGK